MLRGVLTNRPIPCQSPWEAPQEGRLTGRLEQRVQARYTWGPGPLPQVPQPPMKRLRSNEIESGRSETQRSTGHSEKARCDSGLETQQEMVGIKEKSTSYPHRTHGPLRPSCFQNTRSPSRASFRQSWRNYSLENLNEHTY